MQKRLVTSLLLINIILISSLTINSSANDEIHWNPDWSFKQKIKIPINTSNENAKFQPIDIPIEFQNPCWAKNENEHSVRVILNNIMPLECQIYDLKYEKENFIKACNLVFLIPEEADGNEKYYVYYDDNEKPDPNYEDYVTVVEDEYAIEPISGYAFKSSFLGIKEKGFFVYAVALEGKFLDSSTSQQVTKLKTGTKEILPKNGEQLVSFNLEYWYLKDKIWHITDTGEKFEDKEIYEDGNLMVKFGIVSRNANGHFQTTVIYKYYYCPTEEKRIYTHVKHEVIDYPLPPSEVVTIFYTTLRGGGIRSSAIEELNFGSILPFLHIYDKNEQILPFDVKVYPESGWEMILAKEGDIDLGSHAWVSFDEGESGKAYAVILNSTNVLKSGSNEPDGVQITAYEGKETGFSLPGLDPRFAFIYLNRNKFDIGKEEDNKIPKDFVIEFDAEFFSTENGGFKAVDDEATIFQSLVKYQPKSDFNVTNGDEEKDKFSLTAYAHLAPSFPLGSVWSTLLNKNISYISAELYKDDSYERSKPVERLPFKGIDDIEFKLGEIIKMIRTLVDWKNKSFFKKVRFSDLVAGRYLIKIYRVNRILGQERQFIGYAIVELDKDKTIRIFCRPEGKIKMSIFNQYNTGLENTNIYLMRDDLIIAESQSDNDGSAVIGVPCSLRDTYNLNVVYKGFLVHQEQTQVGFIRRIIPLEKEVSFNVYNLTINLTTADGGSPEFNIDMELTSKEMAYPTKIPAEKINNKTYNFINLYPADYTLDIQYKSFNIEESVNIPSTSFLDINLYNLTVNLKDEWNLPPEISLNLILTNDEFKKPLVLTGDQISAGKYLYSDLYPADYKLKLFYKSYVIENIVSIPYKNNGIYELDFPALYNVTIKVLDARGSQKQDGRVMIIRGGQEVEGIINNEGKKTFNIPPGVYNVRIYSNDNLIAQRKIANNGDVTFTIVTSEEPLLLYIMTGFACIILLGLAFVTYKKKDKTYFLKIVVLILIIIAIILPWWSLQGSSSSPLVETSINMYLVPPGLVSITSTENVNAGELLLSNADFEFAMTLVTILTAIGCICIALNIFFKFYTKMRRLSFISLIFGTILLVCSLLIFLIGMTQVTEVGVGSFMGNGDLEINIPGEEMYETLSCGWGPGFGFYLYITAIALIMLLILFRIRKIFLERKEKILD